MFNDYITNVRRALADPRCAFTVDRGFVILIALATVELVRQWNSKMIYPNLEDVKTLIAEMESETIGLNIRLEPT